MSTFPTNFNESDFLASADLVASLIDRLAPPTPARRSRRATDLPDWLKDRLTAPASEAETPRRFQPPRRAIEPRAPSQAEPPREPEPRIPVKVQAHAARMRRRGRCQCGLCPVCLDNARWERIFNEKFNDPSYYGGLRIRHSSTLAGA